VITRSAKTLSKIELLLKLAPWGDYEFVGDLQDRYFGKLREKE